MRKLILWLLLAVTLATTITGCWSRREINDLAFVLAVGLDRAGADRYRVTLQVAKTKMFTKEKGGGGPAEKGFEVYTATGATPAEAVRNVARQVPRTLTFTYNKIIILGEDLAKTGAGPVLDLFGRGYDFRKMAWLLVTSGKAGKIVEKELDLETVPALTLTYLSKLREDTGKAYVSNVRDFEKILSESGINPVTAQIETLTGGKTKARAQLPGLAVFKKDRLVGWLNLEETRGFALIKGGVRDGVLLVKNPPDAGMTSFNFINSAGQIIPEIKNDELVFTIKINADLALADETGQVDLSDPKMIARLEKKAADAIRREVVAVLDKAQKEYQTDIFGFGQVMARRMPAQWKQVRNEWDTLYPAARVDVRVKAKILNVGLMTERTIIR